MAITEFKFLNKEGEEIDLGNGRKEKEKMVEMQEEA
jgi:hypothetical protein